MNTKICALAGALTLLVAGGPVNASVVFTDRTAFEGATTVDVTEDFETLGPGTASFTGPILMPSGITVSSQSNDLFTVGPGQSTNPTEAIGSNTPRGDSLLIDLGGSFLSFGADFFQNDGGGDQFSDDISFVVDLFLGAALIDSFVATVAPNGGSFFGVIADSLFDNVSILASPTGAFEVVDNVTLGLRAIDTVPLPGSLQLFFTSLALLLFAGWHRRRSFGA